MSATTAGALKAHLEGAKLGLSFYRDRAPKDAVLPFGVITEGISLVPDRDGDTGDRASSHSGQEEVQVSIFQRWRTSDGKAAEDYALPGNVWRVLDGARLITAPTTVYGVKVTGRVRMPDVDAPGGSDAADGANVVHDAFTLTVRRNI